VSPPAPDYRGRNRHIGFTGRSTPVPSFQYEAAQELLLLLRRYPPAPNRPGLAPARPVLHHGDCINADAVAATIARSLGYWIHGHPPTNPKARAWFENDRTAEPLPYLRRNRAIVAASQILVAMPDSYEEKLRDGTWATVRYARQAKIPILLILPDGRIKNA
jgi:hypothetical protein